MWAQSWSRSRSAVPTVLGMLCRLVRAADEWLQGPRWCGGFWRPVTRCCAEALLLWLAVRVPRLRWGGQLLRLKWVGDLVAGGVRCRRGWRCLLSLGRCGCSGGRKMARALCRTAM